MPIDWVPLDLAHGPTFAAQVEELYRAFAAAKQEKNKSVVRYLEDAISERMLDLEDFCLENDGDERIMLFQKQLNRFRKIVHSKNDASSDPFADFMSASGDVTFGSYSMEEPEEFASEEQEKKHQTAEADGRALALSSLTSSYDADDSQLLSHTLASASSRGVRHARKSGSPRKKKGKSQRLLYPWESKVDTGTSDDREVSILLRDDDVFNFQVVLDASDFHHYKQRRTIMRKQREFKEKERLKKLSREEGAVFGDDKRTRNGRRHGGITGFSRAMYQGPYLDPTYTNQRMFRSPNNDMWVTKAGFSTSL